MSTSDLTYVHKHNTERIQMTNKYLRKWSMALATRDMNIKSILRVHLTSGRIIIVKKTDQRNAWEVTGEETLTCCWYAAIMQTSLEEVLQKN